jgi:hypothetical protein
MKKLIISGLAALAVAGRAPAMLGQDQTGLPSSSQFAATFLLG